MSRPSATRPRTPAWRPKLCWTGSNQARTSGKAATWEAALLTSGVRNSSPRTWPSTSTTIPPPTVDDAETAYRIRIRWVGASGQGLPRDGAIERAGIQVRVTESCGDQLGDGALANPGRAVDGDDHRRGAVSPCRGLCVPRTRYCIHPCPKGVNNPLNCLSNPGNEVATQAVSSTRVSPRATSPATIMDMATRWSQWLWQ